MDTFTTHADFNSYKMNTPLHFLINVSSPFSVSPDTEDANKSCRFDEEFKYILLPVSYTIVCVLGLVLNSVALWMFLTKMRPWNASTVYMFIWHCQTCSVRFLFYANLYCSILFLTCISVHRYMGICHPIRSLTLAKPRNAQLVCGLVWAAVTTCLIPNLIFVTTTQRDNDTLCHDTSSPSDFENYVTYSSVVMTLLFGVPFIIIMVCYYLMARALCRPRQISSNQRGKSRTKSIKLIIIVLVVFAVSFVPFHITRTLYYTYRVLEADCWILNLVNLTYKITRPLASSNSCLDPILYFLAGDHYRSKLIRAFAEKRATDNLQSPPVKNNELALVYKNPAVHASSDSPR
ncbi:hypothetical protein AMELA_G00035540 [Ameiurus melas]|uniref:G-protein coupled receptors family 1 profile domain-containing protein n=1 Tax=Ameiurus melas TaxID=219545 RepID=A0A7J6B8F2_AMEME|nr:hypothetical protein AMELA_G00035540 [Ameiurus melas]